MTEPAYSLAPSAAAIVSAFYAKHAPPGGDHGDDARALIPDANAIVEMVDAAFWASLRREEGRPPLISLAFVPPDRAGQPLTFATAQSLAPEALARLGPAVERPGVHLGVWRDGDELRVWGATRTLPELSFVIEVIEPGLVVLKYRRGPELGKFGNMAVLRADQIRVIDEHNAYQPECPTLLNALFAALLDLDAAPTKRDAGATLLQLAVSMRSHGRGGMLLVVPDNKDAWRESIVQPVSYTISPPFSRLAQLLEVPPEERGRAGGRDGVSKQIDMIAGLTAVDGAAVVNGRFEVLAFGVKIGRRDGNGAVEWVRVMEPVADDIPTLVAPVQLGGTRHLSAAQFVHDQHDAVALVASQDGRFTVFAWSGEEKMVHAHRIEALLF
ncbi:MAG: putative sensor domain DACNV-containing protein [bacterium]